MAAGHRCQDARLSDPEAAGGSQKNRFHPPPRDDPNDGDRRCFAINHGVTFQGGPEKDVVVRKVLPSMPHAWAGADLCKGVIEVINHDIGAVFVFDVLDVSIDLVKVIRTSGATE